LKKSNTDYSKLLRLLNEKEYANKYIINAERRMITHWQDIGLFEDQRHTDSGWKKFSLIDILWMGIIIEYRNLGFANERIKPVRKFLFENTTIEGKSISKLEYSAVQVLAFAKALYLITDVAGNIYLADDYEYVKLLQEGKVTNHIVLSLNQVVKENIAVLFSEPNFNAFAGLNKDEIQVMLILRSESYQSVQVTKKNGEIDMIEGTERISEKDRIIDILKQHEYQNIEIKQANGKVVLISRTVKQKAK
jgi:hypothetical protein